MKIHPETQSAFLMGTVVLLSLYLAFVLFVTLQSDQYVEKLEASLAVVMVEIEVPDVLPDVVMPLVDSAASIAPVKEGVPLVRAPFADLQEETAVGMLPIKSPAGVTPFEAYRRNVDSGAIVKPVLALGILDYGISESLSNAAVSSLPGDVVMLASPYADDGLLWLHKARQAGHEVWLNVPFQTNAYPDVDTGQYTILKRSSLRLNMDRLHEALASSTGYAGVFGELDGSLSHAEAMLKGVFSDIYGRGLGYMELNPIGSALVETLAVQNNNPYFKAAMFIDGEDSGYRGELERLLRMALKQGVAAGVVRPTPALLQMLPQWLESLDSQGVTLVPLSALSDL